MTWPWTAPSFPPSGIIDTHAHVFNRRLARAPRHRYSPGYDALPETYLSLLDAHDISAGVLVQPSFLGTDNSHLIEAIALAPERLRGVAVVEPEVAGVELDRLAAAGVRGVRLNLIDRRVPSLGARVWQRLARELAARDLHLEVQARQEQWDALAPWLLRWPAAVVVDHLGLPAAEARSHPGSGALATVLAAEHVWVKAAAPYRSHPGAALAMMRRLLDTGGADRLVWGSDWPWTRHEEGQDYGAALRWLTVELTAAESRRILCDNPARLLSWTPGRLPA